MSFTHHDEVAALPPEQADALLDKAELASRQRVLNWWIGDWWACGQHRYGERAEIAAKGIFGKEFQSMVDMGTVCRSFETTRRRVDLSFTHHREVAALPPEQADALLSKAEDENLSTRDVRKAAMLTKVDLGILRPRDDFQDDPEYEQLIDIARREVL